MEEVAIDRRSQQHGVETAREELMLGIGGLDLDEQQGDVTVTVSPHPCPLRRGDPGHEPEPEAGIEALGVAVSRSGQLHRASVCASVRSRGPTLVP
ncbi:hypothetical protein GCM10027067_04160 [Pseudactinotalea suaedae]